VNTGGVFAGIDGDDLAGVGLHSRLSVTSEAVFILLGKGWFAFGADRRWR
jgi:hypothetical protein